MPENVDSGGAMAVASEYGSRTTQLSCPVGRVDPPDLTLPTGFPPDAIRAGRVTVARTRHQRTTPLLRLLARLSGQRDPDLWTVRCRDQYGRRAQVQVHLTETGIKIATSSPEPLELTPGEAGGLRAALRDGLLSLGQLAGPDGLRNSAHVPRDPPPLNPRQRIRLHRPRRPTVADIAARLAQFGTSDPEADDHHRRDTAVAA